MKVIKDLEQNTPEWLEARKGKIGGSMIGTVMGSKAATKAETVEMLDKYKVKYDPKATVKELHKLLPGPARRTLMKRSKKMMGFYELLAQRVAIEPDRENRMDRGHRLEPKAIEVFEKEYKKKVESVGMCISDFNPGVYNSPDGLIKKGKKYTEAVEVKCLSSARHLKAYIEQEIPDEYQSQMMQYFVVNDDLKTLYWVFYDERIPVLEMHVIEIHRKDVERHIQDYKIFQDITLEEVETWVERLTF